MEHGQGELGWGGGRRGQITCNIGSSGASFCICEDMEGGVGSLERMGQKHHRSPDSACWGGLLAVEINMGTAQLISDRGKKESVWGHRRKI